MTLRDFVYPKYSEHVVRQMSKKPRLREPFGK